MAKGERYYWIKLKKSFLTSEKVDFLLSQPNGSDYVVIYQMLCLKTINTEGELASHINEVIIPFDVEKIQRDLKHFSIDTVMVALELFKRLGMIYEQENGILRIREFDELVGSETDYAIQKRLQRQQVDKLVDNVHTEIRDKSIEYRDMSSKKSFKTLEDDKPGIPDDDEIVEYFAKRNAIEYAQEFRNMMKHFDWKDKNGLPIVRWQGVAYKFIQNQKKIKDAQEHDDVEEIWNAWQNGQENS